MKSNEIAAPVSSNFVTDGITALSIVGLLQRASEGSYILGRVQGHKEVAGYLEKEASRLFSEGDDESARLFRSYRDTVLKCGESIQSTHDEYDGPRREAAYQEASQRDQLAQARASVGVNLIVQVQELRDAFVRITGISSAMIETLDRIDASVREPAVSRQNDDQAIFVQFSANRRL